MDEALKSNDKPWLFKKGQAPGPGRPRGSGKSLKEYSREFLANLNDEERMEFLEGLPKDVIWKMAEGNPKNEADISIKELPIIQVSQAILEKNGINASTGDNSEGQTQI